MKQRKKNCQMFSSDYSGREFLFFFSVLSVFVSWKFALSIYLTRSIKLWKRRKPHEKPIWYKSKTTTIVWAPCSHTLLNQISSYIFSVSLLSSVLNTLYTIRFFFFFFFEPSSHESKMEKDRRPCVTCVKWTKA